MDFVELLDVVLTKVYHVIPMNIQLLDFDGDYLNGRDMAKFFLCT